MAATCSRETSSLASVLVTQLHKQITLNEEKVWIYSVTVAVAVANSQRQPLALEQISLYS